MLDQVKLIKNSAINYTPTSVLKEITSLKYIPAKQTAIDFNSNFDRLVSKHNSLPNAIKLEEKRLSEIYYQAVMKECTFIQTMGWLKSQSGGFLKTDEIETMLLQSQTNRGHDVRETANRATTNVKCHRCTEFGHFMKDCHLNEGSYFCFNCNRVTDHRASECRQQEDNRRYERKRATFTTKRKGL